MLLSEAAEIFYFLCFQTPEAAATHTAEAEVEKAARAGEKDKRYKTQPEGYLRIFKA